MLLKMLNKAPARHYIFFLCAYSDIIYLNAMHYFKPLAWRPSDDIFPLYSGINQEIWDEVCGFFPLQPVDEIISLKL